MNLARYAAESDPVHETYEFWSIGPRGRIKKIVVYEQLASDVYNLSFGDWHGASGIIQDNTRSNNGDRDKILATVANTVLDFLEHHPGVRIVAEGITPGKTRLYQMAINAHFKEITQLFEIKGLTEGLWRSIIQGNNYDAFLLEPK